MLRDDLEGGDGKEGGPRNVAICPHIADSLVVRQKLTQHCKVIILHKKKAILLDEFIIGIGQLWERQSLPG